MWLTTNLLRKTVMSALTDTHHYGYAQPASSCEPRLKTCFHCGEAVPPGLNMTVPFDGEDRAVCCMGCEAVMTLILDSGQDDYYRNRDGYADSVPADIFEDSDQWIAAREFTSRPTATEQR